MPFAGTYTLTGKLTNLQNLRGVPRIDDAYQYLENYYELNNLSNTIKPLKLNTGAEFDLDIKEYNKQYQNLDLDEYRFYIDTKLSKKILSYENDEYPKFDEIYELAKKAHEKFLNRILINNIKIKSDIFIKVNENSLMINKNYRLDVTKTDSINTLSKRYVRYETDPRLLKNLLLGPKFAHWNNAEIGSHLKFFRKPDIFERDIYGSMNYFHC